MSALVACNRHHSNLSAWPAYQKIRRAAVSTFAAGCKGRPVWPKLLSRFLEFPGERREVLAKKINHVCAPVFGGLRRPNPTPCGGGSRRALRMSLGGRLPEAREADRGPLRTIHR